MEKDKEYYKRKFKEFRTISWVMLGVMFIVVLIFGLIINIEGNFANNEAVMYCEIANLNAEIGNEMFPYFEKYMDESIGLISEINSTASELLELSLVGKRELQIPVLDCPIERCNGPFAGPADEGICNVIQELKYRVKL